MSDVNDLLTRGVANIIPNQSSLEQKLSEGHPLNVYLGIDPTAVKIHLGHAVALRKLQKFAELGHIVTFLVGDFTAKVGDTSDKESERPQLTDDEIKENFRTYKEQASKILDFEKVQVRHNSEWLKDLKFTDVLKLFSNFSLNDFISRELIKKRLAAGKSVGMRETLYPVMQGYDSYMLDTDIQIGGTDQTFNMQAGRTLLKDKKESFVLTTEFLPGTDGRKMSKTWGNAIWLDDAAEEIYGKVMSISDEVIPAYLTLATNLPITEVHQLVEEAKDRPMEVKKQLAYHIVSELHDAHDAKVAQEHFEKTVQNKENPHEIPEIEIEGNISVLDFLVENNLTPSKSEAKRLIEQGGVRINETPATLDLEIRANDVIKVGKRNFVKTVKN